MMMLKTEREINSDIAWQRVFGEWLAVLGTLIYALAAMTVITYLFKWSAGK